MVRVRFAPSPTGLLHIGGARTALFNVAFAKKHGGKFILRIDDTDKERSLKENEKDIIDSLTWLGLSWDEGPGVGGSYAPYYQSERQKFHLDAAEYLVKKGAAFKDDGGAVRLKYTSDKIVVKDIICGDCAFQTDALGPDPVILRSDGTPTYHLASVCDDVEMKITHIIRGQDHLTNTAKHQLMFEALGAPVPQFAHLPLILGSDRSKLSKRNTDSVVTVTEFKKQGYLPHALKNFLMLLGWSHPEAIEQFDFQDAIPFFELERINHTGAVFETTKLDFLNGWWIRRLGTDELEQYVWEFASDYDELMKHKSKSFWTAALDALKPEMGNLKDIKRLVELIVLPSLPLKESDLQEINAHPEKSSFQEVCAKWESLVSELILEDGRDSLTTEQFSKLSNTLKKSFSFAPKLIFQAMRFSITGAIRGPELKVLVPLVSRNILKDRAQEALKTLS